MTSLTESTAGVRLAIAALVGLGVGLEREWSGHTSGPDARFAGIRTFLFLGIIGGISGLFLSLGAEVFGALGLLSGFAISIVAYAVTVRRSGTDVDGTTETAALLVVLLGAIAGFGWLSVGAGTGSVVVLALREKSRLHSLVKRIDEGELQGGFLFAVLALVVLPLIPEGPFGGALAIQPRLLWTLVLVFSAINFAGYVARRALGANGGYAIAGTLGGLISSTAVAFAYSRRSRDDGVPHRALAWGVLGACTVVMPRVIVVSTMLNPDVGQQLCILLLPPFLAGCAMLLIVRDEFSRSGPVAEVQLGNPLRLRAAVQMTISFQIAITVIGWVSKRWGSMGVFPAAGLLGLTDMDALTLSMSKGSTDLPAVTAALAIAVGMLANTLLKMSLTLVLGAGEFRSAAASRLIVQAVVSVVTIAAYYFWIF